MFTRAKSFKSLILNGLAFTLFLISRFGYFLIKVFQSVTRFFSDAVTGLKLINNAVVDDTAKRINELPDIASLDFKVSAVVSNLWLPKLPSIKNFFINRKHISKKVKSSRVSTPLPFIFGVVFSVICLYLPLKVYEWYRDLPQPTLLITDGSKKSTQILDRKGRLLYEIYIDNNYEPVKLSQINENFIKATLAVEDSEFYSHVGFRPLSMLRAVKETFLNKNTQGGSTITQQLVKNVLLSSEQTYERKIKELVLAVLVEFKYSKQDILQLYLNNISYGGDAVGVQAAAHRFYGVDVSKLSLAQVTMLAGLPSAPSIYSPVSGNYDLSKQRQKYVLDRMVLLKYITPQQADEAFNENLIFQPQTDYIRAPHFVHLIKDQLYKDFGQRYVETGGLTVTTSLDLDVQDEAQKIVREQVLASKPLNINNGAAVVLDASTAEVLAYVGSVDYFQAGWGSFDVANAKRQPGSSVKPITYSLALTKGYTPATIIEDAPLTIKNAWETYTPVNYDGKFHGNVTVRQALANSYNIPAVKTVQKFGPYNMVDLGNKMGLKEWDVNGKYGVSVTLGGMEVSLLDLTNAYGTLARSGVHTEVKPIISVIDKNGFEVYKPDQLSQQVLSGEVTYLISNILADNRARTPAFGPNSQLVIPNHTVAVKTGTTDNKRDNWTLGYTSKYVVGVWVGNNDNRPMNPHLSSGLSGAAPIWNKIFTYVLNSYETNLAQNTSGGTKTADGFIQPENIITKVDPACGGKSEVFIKGSNIPKNLCVIEHKDDEKDKKSEQAFKLAE